MSEEPHIQCEHNHLSWFYSHKTASLALVVVAVLLIIEHWEHIIIVLPYLVLLSCPLMHLFMHHGHNSCDKKKGNDGTQLPPSSGNP